MANTLGLVRLNQLAFVQSIMVLQVRMHVTVVVLSLRLHDMLQMRGQTHSQTTRLRCQQTQAFRENICLIFTCGICVDI